MLYCDAIYYALQSKGLNNNLEGENVKVTGDEVDKYRKLVNKMVLEYAESGKISSKDVMHLTISQKHESTTFYYARQKYGMVISFKDKIDHGDYKIYANLKRGVKLEETNYYDSYELDKNKLYKDILYNKKISKQAFELDKEETLTK